MARPKKEGMEYFPHDTDAVNDEKIEAMRALYGNDGYAFYFILLERVYRSETAELDVSKFSVRTALISKLSIKKEMFEEMLTSAFEIGLFDKEIYETRQCITSFGVQKRYGEVNKMRQKWREKKEKPPVIPLENLDNKDINQVECIDNKGVFQLDNDEVFPRENNEQKTVFQGDNTTIDIGSDGKMSQSKVKESKGKEIQSKKDQDTSSRQLKYAEDSVPYKMALYLHQKILSHAEESGVGHLVRKTNLQSWADDCRKLLELDKVDKALIRDVIDWATEEKFWKTNILSASKLRDKFQELAIKMNIEKKGAGEDAKHKGGSSGIQSGRTQATSPSESITGGHNGWVPSSRQRANDKV